MSFCIPYSDYLANIGLYDLVAGPSASCLGCGIDVPTPAGLNVQLDPIVQSGDGFGVSLVFSQVLSAGITTVSNLPGNSVNFFGVSLGLLGNFNIATTASFSGDVLVRFTTPLSMSPAEFATLRVIHTSNGVTEDITILEAPYAPDYATRTLYGRTYSFSPVAVAADPGAATDRGVCCYEDSDRNPKCGNMQRAQCIAPQTAGAGHSFVRDRTCENYNCCDPLIFTTPLIKRCGGECFVEADTAHKIFNAKDCRWECNKDVCSLHRVWIEPTPGAKCECKCNGQSCNNPGQIWQDAGPDEDCKCECGGPCDGGDGKVYRKSTYSDAICLCMCDDSPAVSEAKCQTSTTHKIWLGDGGVCSCKCDGYSGWTACTTDATKCMPYGCGATNKTKVEDCLCKCNESTPAGKRQKNPNEWLQGQSSVPLCEFVCDETNTDRDAYCECLKGPNYCTAPKTLKDTISGCECVCPTLAPGTCESSQGKWQNPTTCECECLISDSEICGGKCYPTCPPSQTRNQQSCECECPKANFDGLSVSEVGLDESGKCLYAVTCYKCGECPAGDTRNLYFDTIDGKSCSDFGRWVSSCSGDAPLEYCAATRTCVAACTGGKKLNPACNCVCPQGEDWCSGQNRCETKCTGGKSFDDDCKCVCPEDTRWCQEQGQCVSNVCASPKIYSESRCKCECPPFTDDCEGGKAHDDDCKCVCPEDTQWCQEQGQCVSNICISPKIYSESNCECECPPSADICTGGKVPDDDCKCVCESIGSFEFDWCDAKQICTTKCTGGQKFNDNCDCVCPEGEGWCSGQNRCETKCPGEKSFNDGCNCVCPTDEPLWCPTNQHCIACLDQGSIVVIGIDSCSCGCPNGQDICDAKQMCATECPGNKVFDDNCNCVCTEDYPLWCPSDETCNSCPKVGEILDDNCDCVCPAGHTCQCPKGYTYSQVRNQCVTDLFYCA
jgi:hypothetical protein